MNSRIITGGREDNMKERRFTGKNKIVICTIGQTMQTGMTTINIITIIIIIIPITTVTITIIIMIITTEMVIIIIIIGIGKVEEILTMVDLSLIHI